MLFLCAHTRGLSASLDYEELADSAPKCPWLLASLVFQIQPVTLVPQLWSPGASGKYTYFPL